MQSAVYRHTAPRPYRSVATELCLNSITLGTATVLTFPSSKFGKDSFDKITILSWYTVQTIPLQQRYTEFVSGSSADHLISKIYSRNRIRSPAFNLSFVVL